MKTTHKESKHYETQFYHLPSYLYDYILCTDNITPEQGAQKIMEFIGH